MAHESPIEATLALQMRAQGVKGYECEYRFYPTRSWRFDFAWPERRLAVEVEGGTWSQGRHTRGRGFAADCAKYNAAALLGWRVLRFTGEMVEDWTAVEMVQVALSEGHSESEA